MRPAYFDYWTPLWHLAVIAVVGVVVFWLLFESTEEDYVEYLFADFAVAIGSEGSTVSFAEDDELAVSGELHGTLNRDSVPTRDTDTADINGNGSTDASEKSNESD